jgi:hypothetical protein
VVRSDSKNVAAGPSLPGGYPTKWGPAAETQQDEAQQCQRRLHREPQDVEDPGAAL